MSELNMNEYCHDCRATIGCTCYELEPLSKIYRARDLEKLQSENAKLKKALMFYADRGNWYKKVEDLVSVNTEICPSDIEFNPPWACGGKFARATLKECKK